MAKISLFKKHQDSKDDARKKVEGAIDDPVSKFGLSKTWDGDTLKVKGKGVDGTLVVTENGVDINMKLSLPASLAKRSIEKQLKAELDQAFG